MVIKTVETRATKHPIHMFCVGDSPDKVASTGVRIDVTCPLRYNNHILTDTFAYAGLMEYSAIADLKRYAMSRSFLITNCYNP